MVRTHENKTDPLNQTLFHQFITNNFGQVEFFDEIMECILICPNNNYLIKLLQLLIKSNSSDFYENRLSFFLSKLIAIILNSPPTNLNDHLFNGHLKKNIPTNLKVQTFYVH
jgi:hypothetical protein